MVLFHAADDLVGQDFDGSAIAEGQSGALEHRFTGGDHLPLLGMLDLLRRPTPTAVVVSGRFGQPPTVRMAGGELPLLRFLEEPLVHYPGIELVVDATLSPRTATANGVLRFVRGDVAGVTTFLQGELELLEFEIRSGSAADDKSIADLGLPRDVLIVAVVRDGRAQIARGRTVLRKGDHVMVMAEPDAVEVVAKSLD